MTRLYGVSSNLWVTGHGTFPGWWDGNVDPVEEMGSVEAREPFGGVVAPDGSVYTTEVYYHIIRHVTGTGLAGPQPGYLPLFSGPMGIALDSASSHLFIANQTNNAVQVLDFSDNQTTTFLNASDGINQPVAVAVDTNDNLYVLNQGTNGNGSIMEFDPWQNPLGTIAAGLTNPTAMTLDGYGNIFVAERRGAVLVFNPNVSPVYSNTIVTITTTNVQLQGIALFDSGAIAVSDAGNHVIWQINPITKQVSRLTGQTNQPGSTLGGPNFAKLNQPHQLARAAGNQLVVADYGNNRLVTVNSFGSITNVLNSTNSVVWFGRLDDPVRTNSTQWVRMALPVGVAVGAGGEVYCSEVISNDCIRGILGTGLAQPLPGPFDVLPFFGANGPMGIALDNGSSQLFIADQANNAVQVLNFSDNLTSTYLTSTNQMNRPVAVAVDTNDNLFVLNQGTGGDGTILEFNRFGNCLATNASGLVLPIALTLDGYGNIFVAEQGGAVKVFGAGVFTNLLVTVTNAGVQLEGIALFDDGAIAVSDAGNHVIWQINPITKAVSLLTGIADDPGNTIGIKGFAQLNKPQQLARANGNLLVVADNGNNRLVVVDRSGSITNVLNSTNANVWYGQPGDPVGPASARSVPMISPVGVAVGAGGTVYSSETLYNDIRGLLGTGLIQPPPGPFDVLPFFGPTVRWASRWIREHPLVHRRSGEQRRSRVGFER